MKEGGCARRKAGVPRTGFVVHPTVCPGRSMQDGADRLQGALGQGLLGRAADEQGEQEAPHAARLWPRAMGVLQQPGCWIRVHNRMHEWACGG